MYMSRWLVIAMVLGVMGHVGHSGLGPGREIPTLCMISSASRLDLVFSWRMTHEVVSDLSVNVDGVYVF
jgi:hypothetical protein